jgi:hypothetical protein
MIPTAYLRVYQPLASFPEAEKKRLAGSPEEPRPEAEASHRWLISGSMPIVSSPFGLSDGAFVRSSDGISLVCPWRTRMRMLSQLVAFCASVPEEVAEAFVPEEQARRAARELEALCEQYPEARLHILHANWHVPLRWFSAFDDSERILTEDAEGLRVRYETWIGLAQERCSRARSVLDVSPVGEEVAEGQRDLVEWLADFPADGLLELDYGSVARMFSDDELVEDRTSGELWACLRALEGGDVGRAGAALFRLGERWAEVRAHEAAN